MDRAQGAGSRLQLRVLRRMESILRCADHCHHRLRLVRRAMDGSNPYSLAAQGDHGRVDRDQLKRARLFQVCAILCRQRRRSPQDFQCRLQALVARHPAAGGHFLLHLRKPVLRHRRLSQAHRGLEEPPGLRTLRHLFPAPGRRTDPALWRLFAAMPRTEIVALGARRPRADAARLRSRAQGLPCGSRLRSCRRQSFRTRRRTRICRELAGRRCLFAAGVMRFRRLFPVRDRHRADVRFSFPDEFRKPLWIGRDRRAVDALAHVARKLDA